MECRHLFILALIMFHKGSIIAWDMSYIMNVVSTLFDVCQIIWPSDTYKIVAV